MVLIEQLKRAGRRVERTAPLLPVALGLLLGIVIDQQVGIDPRAALLVFVLSGALLFVPGSRRRIGVGLMLAAAACVGAVVHFRAARYVPADSIEHYADYSSRISRVRGTVVTTPRVLRGQHHPFRKWTYRTCRTAFLVDADTLEGVEGDFEVSGRIRVTVSEAVLDLAEGERVELFGHLAMLLPPANPGSFDWATYNRRQGVVATLYCDQRENVRCIDGGRVVPGPGLVQRFRNHVRGLLTDDLVTGADEEASLLQAMILGHRSQLDRRLNDVFIRSGCIHFLAVSGTHVGIVMLLAWWACRLISLPRRTSVVALAAVVLIYAVLAEPRPPILRATVMAVLFCLSLLLRRQYARLNWISAAAIFLALLDPAGVLKPGFQLSFAAVLGLGYLIGQVAPAAKTAAHRLEMRWLLGRFALDVDLVRVVQMTRRADQVLPRSYRILLWAGRAIAWALGISFSAWLACLPIVASYFERLPLWGAINSAIVFPLVALVMFLGFAKLIVGVVSPTLGSLAAYPLTWADSLLIWVVDHLAELPWASITVPSPPWWVVVSYYLLLGSFVWLFAPEPRRRPADTEDGGQTPGRVLAKKDRAMPRRVGRHRLCAVAMVTLALCVTAWQWPTGTPGRGNDLVVTVLSVGAGSAMVLELPDGRTILLDAGSSRPYDVGASTVLPFLRSRNIDRIDRVYLSHPNLDHFSGLPSVLDGINTGPICVNEYFEPLSEENSPARYLLDILKERDHSLEIYEASTADWWIGDVHFERLWPPAPGAMELDANDSSTVLRVSYGGHSILLTGDIEQGPQAVLARPGNVSADVLVLPHHGSIRPSSAEFFRAVSPRFFVRSSNERMTETYSGLAALVGDTPLFNTADVGAVQIVLSAGRSAKMSEASATNRFQEANGMQVRGFREPLAPSGR